MVSPDPIQLATRAIKERLASITVSGEKLLPRAAKTKVMASKRMLIKTMLIH